MGAVLTDGVGTWLAVSAADDLVMVIVAVTGQTVVVSATTEVMTSVVPAVETVMRLVE